jgi:hypothetical protein
MAFLHEDVEHATDGHGSRRVRQFLADLQDGGLAAGKEDVHDLPLAPA